MTTVSSTVPARQGWGGRLLRFPLIKMIVAVLLAAASAGITFSIASAIADKPARMIWPEIVSAIGVLLTYAAYVRHVEKRPAAELSRAGAFPEFGLGLLIGAAMVAAEIGILYALGFYEPGGFKPWTMKIAQALAVMLFIGVLEEVIGRGIVFRITEESLGSWPALLVSALLFGLLHLPNAGAGPLSIGITVVAGAFFAAAYMLTRRLWLCIGIHAAWNFTLGSIFSIAVSGNESDGLIVGTLSGPAWITGGSYGLEASILTLLTLVLVGGVFLRLAWKRGHVVVPARRRGKAA